MDNEFSLADMWQFVVSFGQTTKVTSWGVSSKEVVPAWPTQGMQPLDGREGGHDVCGQKMFLFEVHGAYVVYKGCAAIENSKNNLPSSMMWDCELNLLVHCHSRLDCGQTMNGRWSHPGKKLPGETNDNQN